MEPFITLLESERCTNLLLALAHTLWQGALAAGILYLYLRQAPAEAVGKRYAAGIAALGAIVLAALLTWSILGYEPAATQDEVAPTQLATDAPQAPEPTAPKIASPAREIQTIPQAPRSRQIWIMGAWLAGVGVMFLRMVVVVVGGSRLRGQCRPLENVETLDLIEQLRAGMGIGRRIRVLIGERISTPGVIGCFWPTLLLPASMLSGIPADDLRAILVHELAHIRRYDYLVNFLQMVVEALLFFNPAVWWISRQIRIEREACCDAAGVRWIGQRDKYAEALVAWAHRLGTPAPAVGFGRNTDPGTLLDRVKRILIANHQPRPRVPWHIATAMVVLSLACLVLIGQATGLAVSLAGRILTHQERINAIADISKEYGNLRQYAPEDKIEVSGVVRTYDGGPLPARVHLRFRGGWSSYVTSVSAGISKDGAFRQRLDCGRVYIMASGEGYAPAFVGPLEAEPGGSIEGVELLLSKGFSGRIRITDEAGQPVRDAELVGGYEYPDPGSYHHTIKLHTDADGIAILDHIAAEKIALRITADGFEPHPAQGLVFVPDEIRTITLRRARPAIGLVLAETTGLPIEGAEVRILNSEGNRSYGANNDVTRAPDAVTNTEGKFELSQLRRDSTYLLFIRASGFSYRYVSNVGAADSGVVASLGPKKIIRGRITGDLSLLATDGKSNAPILHMENAYQFAGSGYSHRGDKRPVTLRDGVGYFEIDDFWGQTVTLTAGLEAVTLDVEKDRLDDVVLDMQPSEKREIVLRFMTPQGAPPIQGSVRVSHITERARRQKQTMKSEWLDITDGQARCEIPVPADIRCGIDFYQGRRPVGYWFYDIDLTHIAPGGEPYVIDVQTYPAGAIYGRILRPDGNIATNARAGLMLVTRHEIAGRQAASLFGLSSVLNNSVDQGTFNTTPLPFGNQYTIVAYEGNVFAISDTFSLGEKDAIVNVDLVLPSGIDVRGRLLDVDGTAARRSVTLCFSLKRGEDSWGTSTQTETDEAGGFVFKNVNPSPAGTCFIQVIGGVGYRPVRREIKNLRSPMTIQLEKGLRITGAVIDDATDRPVPDAEVYALSVDGPRGGYYSNAEGLEADGQTDAQGRFTFSNMADGYYCLNIRSANLADTRRPLVVKGGQKEPATVRIVIPAWSNLKPRSP